MPLHLLFFCSGLSGLLYQVVWVRQFGHIYGNTVHSASIVVAIFMVGLGTGSYLLGAWADRRYASRPESLVSVYALLESVIAGCGLLLSLALPHLAATVARLSSYEIDSAGWHTLTTASYLWRGAIAIALLAPMTVLMGGTFTVLIRAQVHSDVRSSGWRVALLYGVNTLGAAAGAFLTDFVLVPQIGLFFTQLVAVALNLIAAGGAFGIARKTRKISATPGASAFAATALPLRPRLRRDSSKLANFASEGSRRVDDASEAGDRMPASVDDPPPGAVRWTAVAVALSGFAALGMEMLWLRHLAVLLGGFRAVFSLMLTVMLLAMGTGALVGGCLDRRLGQPARTLTIVQALFVAAMLLGLAWGSAEALAVSGGAIAQSLAGLSQPARVLRELWFDLRPMLLEVALPSLVAGLAVPLANAIVQRAEASIGRRAGALYAANTIGAVAGSLAAGYLLLPRFGMQTSAGILAMFAALTIWPLYLTQRPDSHGRRAFVASGFLAVGALAIWMTLPADFLVQRALGSRRGNERIVALSEGVTELIAVVERPGRGRGLLTNGHAMSSTALLDQRYMRALAHIPLLAMERPQRALVIGFGVGNTAHAAALHSSVRQVDVAELSRHILEHAGYFREANRDVVKGPKLRVYINDGRQHLQMTPPGRYDLITLEPPPIAHAGVAALYSREFYQLARSRLTSGGYISQWLPAYQVPAESSLAMVRAFVDVFPQSVLLSGTQAELLLIGTAAPRIEIDPMKLAAALEREAAVREDLARLDLASAREIAGTFVGSAETLARATAGSVPVTDDHPLQEYGVLSGLSAGLMGVPSVLFDVTGIAAWCARCVDEEAGQTTRDLDLYLRLLQQAYLAPVTDAAALAAMKRDRRLLGSAYLGTVVPDSAEVHNLLGVAAMRADRVEEAVREFQEALAKEPGSANARVNLGQIRYEQGADLLESRHYADAEARLREAIDLVPGSAEAHNDLGVALASTGRVEEAAQHFHQALELAPAFAEARRNLESAQRRPPRTGS